MAVQKLANLNAILWLQYIINKNNEKKSFH